MKRSLTICPGCGYKSLKRFNQCSCGWEDTTNTHIPMVRDLLESYESYPANNVDVAKLLQEVIRWQIRTGYTFPSK